MSAIHRRRWGAWFAASLALVGLVAWLATGSRGAGEVAVAEPGASGSPAEARGLREPIPAETAPSTAARVEMEQAPSTVEQDLLAQGVPIARFRGRLVYESTGEGLPWFKVSLRGVGPQIEVCTTDEQGRFQSKHRLPLRGTSAVFRNVIFGNYWEGAFEVQREDPEAEVVIAVRAPPTFVIDGGFPAGLDVATLEILLACGDSLEGARLQLAGEQWFLREDQDRFEHRHDPAEIARAAAHQAEQDARQRALEAEWRLDPTQFSPELEARGPKPVVLFEGNSRTWTAEVRIEDPQGVVRIAPQWRLSGALAVAIRGNWTWPPAWMIQVELLTGRGDSGNRGTWARLSEHRKAPISLTDLEPGGYTLVVQGDLCRRIEWPVAVRAGEVTEVAIELDCEASAGSIRGEITSESGQRPELGLDSDFLVVDLLRGEWLTRANLVPGEGTGPWKLTFEVPDVPTGDIEIRCFAGLFGTEPFPAIAHGGEAVRFRVLDRPTYIDLGFRVFDASTGAELAAYDADLSTQSPEIRPLGCPSGAITALQVPENGRIHWTVTSPGYLCAEGSLQGTTTWSRREGSKRWIDVHLQRGWRVLCVAMDQGFEHLQDATILVDGAPVGTTDAEGCFTLTLPERPRSLAMRYGDWRVALEHEQLRLEELRSCDLACFYFERPR